MPRRKKTDLSRNTSKARAMRTRRAKDRPQQIQWNPIPSTALESSVTAKIYKKASGKCLLSAESSVTTKQEIDVEEEENSFVFESVLVKEETNLEESDKDGDMLPFASVIVKEETREAEDVEDYDYEEEKEETEENALEVASPSTIKQENDLELEKNHFPFESVFIKEEREEEEEEIYGYDGEGKTENNDHIPEALSGAVADVLTNVTGDVAQRMRARFRSILFRRIPATPNAAPSASASSGHNSVMSSSLVQTKSQPPRGGPFQCGECGMGFKNEQNMWMHEFACKENAAVSKAGRETKEANVSSNVNESEEQRRKKLEKKRLRSKQRREEENQDERNRRLTKERIRIARRRNEETEEQKIRRLEDLKMRAKRRRDEETEDQKRREEEMKKPKIRREED